MDGFVDNNQGEMSLFWKHEGYLIIHDWFVISATVELELMTSCVNLTVLGDNMYRTDRPGLELEQYLGGILERATLDSVIPFHLG